MYQNDRFYTPKKGGNIKLLYMHLVSDSKIISK